MVSTEELHKEIDLIQNCITRMANNSFLLKGWLVSLLVVFITVSPNDTNPIIAALIMLSLTAVFWYLDAFFLRMERLYIKLYNWVLEKRLKGNKDFQYNLDAKRFESEVGNVWSIMVSPTLRVFYFAIIVLILIFMAYSVGAYYNCR